jgi:hypothetical protein
MRLTHLLLALTLLAISAHLALAGDIVAMPTGNMMPAKTISLGYIYWNTEGKNGVGDVTNVAELFYGVTDRLELDYLWLQPSHWDKLPGADSSMSELNAYYAVAKEKTGTHPSFIVGATNLTGNKWLPSASRPNPPSFDDRVSCFALSSYNVKQPMGPPSWENPLVRVHLGWGNNWHINHYFGGVQVMFSPKYGAALLNYQGQPAYLAAWMPIKGLELNAGWDQGDPLGHVAYTKTF